MAGGCGNTSMLPAVVRREAWLHAVLTRTVLVTSPWSFRARGITKWLPGTAPTSVTAYGAWPRPIAASAPTEASIVSSWWNRRRAADVGGQGFVIVGCLALGSSPWAVHCRGTLAQAAAVRAETWWVRPKQAPAAW